MRFSSLLPLLALPSLIAAQLSGSVGPLTSRASKSATKTCNVLNYGAKADKSTDLGPPLASAFAACKSGGTIVIPSGNYAMATWQTLSGGNAFAIQLDGIIYRTGTAGGHMIIVENGSDFELFSSTSKGAIQGYGYVFTSAGTYGPRLIRMVSMSHFSIHDIALVDSPAFHLVVDACSNGEIYNMIIRGGNEGGLDGIDVWGTNIWIHDVEVTNKDECVTVKNPSSNLLIESIYCNWSGGCAMGSLGASTAISNIEYRNIYTWQSNQMYMIKSNGGDGTVSGCTFSNFIGHSNAYSLDLNAYWSSETVVAGSGILYENIAFNDWTGTAANGLTRGPINVICPSGVPCHGITISDFAMWTDSGSSIKYTCENAYGTGACLKSGSSYSAYTTVTTLTAAPSGYSAPKMAADLGAGVGLSVSIAIPAVPTSFFPGLQPISALLAGSAATGTATTLQTTTATGSTGTATGTVADGGTGYTGATVCVSPYTCTYSTEYYSQCL